MFPIFAKSGEDFWTQILCLPKCVNSSFSAICDLREFFARIDFIGAASSRLHCLFWSKEPFLGLIGLVLVGPSPISFNSRKEPRKLPCWLEMGRSSIRVESRRRLSLNFEIELSSVAVDSLPLFSALLSDSFSNSLILSKNRLSSKIPL